jgi:hypothetical protein
VASYEDQPLSELPVLTKAAMMEHFDEFVTDRTLRLKVLEAHLGDLKGLAVLLAGAPERFSDEELGRTLRQALAAQAVIVPPITVRWVEAIPRATLGKAPLIRSNVPRRF